MSWCAKKLPELKLKWKVLHTALYILNLGLKCWLDTSLQRHGCLYFCQTDIIFRPSSWEVVQTWHWFSAAWKHHFSLAASCVTSLDECSVVQGCLPEHKQDIVFNTNWKTILICEEQPNLCNMSFSGYSCMQCKRLTFGTVLRLKQKHSLAVTVTQRRLKQML